MTQLQYSKRPRVELANVAKETKARIALEIIRRELCERFGEVSAAVGQCKADRNRQLMRMSKREQLSVLRKTSNW